MLHFNDGDLLSPKNPATAWLSNLLGHGFVLEGVKWRSVEHFYHSAKYEEATVAKRVREATTALAARKAGQGNGENRLGVMLMKVRA